LDSESVTMRKRIKELRQSSAKSAERSTLIAKKQFKLEETASRQYLHKNNCDSITKPERTGNHGTHFNMGEASQEGRVGLQ
jgi:hypothetical protein